jgi:hypothetical protein
MKLPWYVKQVERDPSKTEDGKLHYSFEIRKPWIYWQYVKVFFQKIGKARIRIEGNKLIITI